MTPVEVIHTVLTWNAEDMWPNWKKPGGPVVVQIGAWDAAEQIVAALTGAGMVVVSAEDLRTYLDRGKDLSAEVAALRRLRAALPEETPDA
ncbi:hypothetical protein [Nonomuraea sp. NPDC049400]|uniref:hypothetical protein n=1 Tax=Nonomuraea sp. NPDC049400 TaxID=3364352 RepID=UPI0037AEBCFF